MSVEQNKTKDMNMDLKTAHQLLKQHADESEDINLQKALHDLAVQQEWEEPEAAEIAAAIRI